MSESKCSECGWSGGGIRDEGCLISPCHRHIPAVAATPSDPIADRLVDWVYLHATEGQQWPSPKTKSMLIARAMQGEPTQDHADGMKAAAPGGVAQREQQLQEAVTAAHAAFEAIPIGYPLQQNGRTIDHTLLNEAKRLCEQAVAVSSTEGK